jgi:hypothetical protein
MPNQDTNNTEQSGQMDMNQVMKGLLERNPYLKGAAKAAEKKGASDFEQAAQAEGGMQANQQLLGQLMQMIQPFDVPGTKIGTMGAVDNFLQGKGFNPEQAKQAQLKPSLALSIMEMAQKQEGLPQEQAKKDIDIIKGLMDIQGSTPEGQRQAEVFKAQGQALAQEEKKRAETERNVRIANNKLALTMKKFDEMVTETEKQTGKQAGRVGGAFTSFLGKTGKNPKVAPFKGQLVETSIALAKIAAPSAKVGPEFAKLMATTLPDNFSNMEEARGQIITSMTNAFANYAASNPDEFPEFDVDTFEAAATEMVDTIVNRQKSLTQKVESKTGEVKGKIQKVGRFQVEVEDGRGN